MTGFMENIPTNKLEDIYTDAMTDGLEAAANLALSELTRRREALASFALSNGVYDASQDEYEVTEHPNDSIWRGYD